MSQWATFWVKRQAVPSSVASAMATVPLYTRNAGDLRVFWQGPSAGFDAGADGGRNHDAGLQPAADRSDFRSLRRHQRLGLLYWRLRHDRTYCKQNCCGPNSIRHRSATWSQSRLPEVHRQSHLESVLIARGGIVLGGAASVRGRGAWVTPWPISAWPQDHARIWPTHFRSALRRNTSSSTRRRKQSRSWCPRHCSPLQRHQAKGGLRASSCVSKSKSLPGRMSK